MGREVRLVVLAGTALLALTAAARAQGPSAAPATAGARALTVVDLQPFRRTSEIAIDDGAGRRGRATLVDLNPHARAWYLLTLAWEDGTPTRTFHLESADPVHQQLRLDPARPRELVVATAAGGDVPCRLWAAGVADGLAAAEASRAPWTPLCDERLYLRRPAKGRRSTREWATDLLRDHVWGGEKITTLVRDTFFRDRWLERPRLSGQGAEERHYAGAPDPPRLLPPFADDELAPGELGLPVEAEPGGKLGVGHWYPVLEQPGVFLSAVMPGVVAPEVLAGVAHPVRPLDAVEAGAVAYLVAFDLARFDVGFAVGTRHPRVGWSDHIAPGVRDPALPGPDGIGSVAPLVRTGMLSPAVQGRAAATFTGGFKRTHGAMRWGALAARDRGSHYGFVEEGVVLSNLQPGLATVTVDDGGRVDLRTWRPHDADTLARLRFARQNGVPLIERDPASGRSEPGALVTRWGPGNWSGSADRKLRTLRAGLCLLEQGARRFLVYGWFSTATPSAMATVFQGYRCRYAMLLDMNALEHTYLALYRREGAKLLVQHLVRGMSVLDREDGDTYLPRFVAFPDTRDFFYLLRRPGR